MVDEAHHALAPTYRRIINEIRKKVPTAKLLGLTATPIRHNDRDTVALGKFFDKKIIFSVPMSKLISYGTLSKPIKNTIQTNLERVYKLFQPKNSGRKKDETQESGV